MAAKKNAFGSTKSGIAPFFSDKFSKIGIQVNELFDEEELRAKLAEQREELMTARFKHATAQLEKTSELKAMRRQVARISTVLTEKE